MNGIQNVSTKLYVPSDHLLCTAQLLTRFFNCAQAYSSGPAKRRMRNHKHLMFWSNNSLWQSSLTSGAPHAHPAQTHTYIFIYYTYIYVYTKIAFDDISCYNGVGKYLGVRFYLAQLECQFQVKYAPIRSITCCYFEGNFITPLLSKLFSFLANI